MTDPTTPPGTSPAAGTLTADPETPGSKAPRPRVRKAGPATNRKRALASYPLRNVGTITGRELQAYFASPIAYLVSFGFLFINGYLYWVILVSSRQASLVSVFGDMAIVLLFISPAITMRLLSEEQRSGTIELLLTSPVREAELVLGKWLAAMALFLAMLVLTLPYPLFLLKYGQPDIGPMLSGYLGIFLLEGVFLAVGLFMSSLTQNQIVAFVLSVGLLLVLWLLQGGGQNLGQGGGNPVLTYIALSPHYDGFTSGSIQLKDLVYYVSLILLALFLTVRSLETRRWR
ncbi:MAG: ABC transporter permease subunit [Chloroflexota bacterium]